MRRVVIITGGGRGIGREIALRIGERGDIPIVVDKDFTLAKETEDLIKRTGFAASAYKADLTQPNEVARVFEEIVTNTEKIDVLINNAGYYTGPKPIEELTIDFWDFVIAANLRTSFLCSLEAFKYMKSLKYGKIVNISSALALTSGTGFCPYIAAKAGIIGLTRALAMDMGPYNITVNAIALGLTSTEYTYQVMGHEIFDRVKELRALKREQLPSDLLGPLLFLIEPSSDFITGQTIVVDGGRAFI
jgi:3-oxoacyl-[acyl-carrier protein] reductase